MDRKKEIEKKLLMKKHIEEILHSNESLLKQLHRNPSLPDMDSILEFAELITPSSHAPKNWKPGFPLFGSHPPQPLFEEMRCGSVEAYNSKVKKNIELNKDAIVTNSKKRDRDKS